MYKPAQILNYYLKYTDLVQRGQAILSQGAIRGRIGAKSLFLKIDSLNLCYFFAQRSILLALLFYLSPIVKIKGLTPKPHSRLGKLLDPGSIIKPGIVQLD